MTIPALPDDLKELVMFDWYTALWQRMHKRRARECGHLRWMKLYYDDCAGWWEEAWSSCIDNDVAAPSEDYIEEEDARMWVAEQYEDREWVLAQMFAEDDMIPWVMVKRRMLNLATHF